VKQVDRGSVRGPAPHSSEAVKAAAGPTVTTARPASRSTRSRAGSSLPASRKSRAVASRLRAASAPSGAIRARSRSVWAITPTCARWRYERLTVLGVVCCWWASPRMLGSSAPTPNSPAITRPAISRHMSR
jgi:hypothetical protein